MGKEVQTDKIMPERQLTKRATLKSIAMSSVAAFAAVAASRPAYAHQSPTSECFQDGWRWCVKCQGMFYGLASAGKGKCPAGGAHDDSASGHYLQKFGQDKAGQQGGWRWCVKCAGFFYARASAGKGVCPGGGAHDDSASGQYAALLGEDGKDPSGQLFQQGGWRWCVKCQGMFYARASAGKGVCPAGATHDDRASGKYATML